MQKKIFVYSLLNTFNNMPSITVCNFPFFLIRSINHLGSRIPTNSLLSSSGNLLRPIQSSPIKKGYSAFRVPFFFYFYNFLFSVIIIISLTHRRLGFRFNRLILRRFFIFMPIDHFLIRLDNCFIVICQFFKSFSNYTS